MAKDRWRLVVLLMAIYSAWTFTKRVKRRWVQQKEEKLRQHHRLLLPNGEEAKEGQEITTGLKEMNNNSHYYNTSLDNNNKHVQQWARWSPRDDVVMCDKSTQWEDQSDDVSVNANPERRSQLTDSGCGQGKPMVTTTTTKRPSEGPQIRGTVGGAVTEEGFTARKIKQLMGTTSSTSSNHPAVGSNVRSTGGDKRIAAQLGGLKTTLNGGHVNDLKMRFEDRHGETNGNARKEDQKYFQRAVDNVTVMKRFTSKMQEKNRVDEVHREKKEKLAEDHLVINGDPPEMAEDQLLDLSPTVVLRRKMIVDRNGSLERLSDSERRRKAEFAPEFGGSVHSLEDILNQQRFSRSLSQYSVSDLFRNESPAEISRNCERFDELFSCTRSTEDLTITANGRHRDDHHLLSKFGSMVDVVNV